MKEVPAYLCEHCGKVYLKRHACKKHEEEICPKNPEIRPLCYSCEHYHEEWDKKELIIYYRESYWGRDTLDKEFNVSTCQHPDNLCKIYNNVKLSDEMRKGLSDYGFVPMPTRKTGGCKFYKAIPDHPYADKQQKSES